MGIQKQALPVKDLAVGMYVSDLDRPWIETPFLFQGFLIESSDVIEELKEYCQYVYIDVERSDVPDDIAARSTADAGAIEIVRPKRKTNGTPPKPEAEDVEDDDDSQILKAELVHAREAHVAAENAIDALFAKLRAGEDIDATSIHQALDPMIDSIMRNDDAMSWLARMKKKGDYIYDHSIASSIWAMIFGKHLGLDKEELHVLGTGAVFLDVGKTRLPSELLEKTGQLTPEESTVMRKHVAYGVKIVSSIEGIDPRVVQMVAGHHERHNGTGYPKGLSGAQIPVFARIAGIVDAYDAMTTSRPYAEPISTYDAIRQLHNLSGVEFPEEVVDQFVQAIGVFPVGTLVELNTGEVGIIIAQNRVRRLRPKIMLLLDADKNPLPTFKIIDLRNKLADESNTSLWIEQGLPPGAFGLDPSEYYL
ncbi:MAG: HD-GYP domain-containing protein [Gammaproteobacteria bacterium]|nr:HD-GYP domain-containing protein [Gammaproteobacteria bacterium]